MFDPSEKRKRKNGFYPGMLGPAWVCITPGLFNNGFSWIPRVWTKQPRCTDRIQIASNFCCEYSRVIRFDWVEKECPSKETFQVRGCEQLERGSSNRSRMDVAVIELFSDVRLLNSLFFFFFSFFCLLHDISLGRKIVSGKKYKGSGVTGQKESEARPTDRGWTAIPRQDARAWQCVRISARRGLQRSAPSDQGGAVHLVRVEILIAVVLPRCALLEQRNGRWFLKQAIEDVIFGAI